MGAIKLKRAHNKIDLSQWVLTEIEGLQRTIASKILAAASEALRLSLQESETRVEFPAVWAPRNNGYTKTDVNDPLTLYLALPLADCGDEPVVFKFNIRESLAHEIAAVSDDGSYSLGLGRISKALRSLAEEIDNAIADGEQQRAT